MPGLIMTMSAPFVEIERDFAQRLVGIGGIHLEAVLVALAEVGRRADRVAERTVEARGVLGRVREDARVDVARLLERVADRADAPVHHVRRRDDVGAGLGVRQRLPTSAATVTSFRT